MYNGVELIDIPKRETSFKNAKVLYSERRCFNSYCCWVELVSVIIMNLWNFHSVVIDSFHNFKTIAVVNEYFSLQLIE